VGRVVTGKIALDRGTIDFSDLVRRTTTGFRERELQHQFEVTTTPAWIEGDAVRIEQIISNIIGNAVKYTPPGGNIRVSLTAEDDEAVLHVEDDGLGIAPELLPNVFDLFVQGERTLDRAQGGLGIGLTLVRRLVSLHHGTVSVTSGGPGCGSVFTVRLPRVAAAVRSNGPGSAASEGDAVKRRVLIVEDNRDAREMFRTMLELDGHEVLEADEGFSGLRLLENELPDIAFIDVGLPGLDGYEIARRFRGGGVAKGASGGGGGSTKGASYRDGSSTARGGAPFDDGNTAKGGSYADGAATSLASAGGTVADAASAAATTSADRGDRSREDKRVLLVALTGYGMADAFERSRRAGFDHHLIKPVNPEALYKLMGAMDSAHSPGERPAAATQIRTSGQSSSLAPRALAQPRG
jgi:CheY-like chemotaxis protein/anti-sigma regulatory factor (Ser/Thr protein kinase)